jgi:hypothetical protein
MTESVIATTSAAAANAPAPIEEDSKTGGEKSNIVSENASLAGDTDDASSYQTCNSGSPSLNSTGQMVTANTTLASTNNTIVDEGGVSDVSTPKVVKSTPVSPVKVAVRTPTMARMGLFGALKATRMSETPVASKSDQELVAAEMLLLSESVMNWNYSDFTQADHRIKLYCDLSLCEESDESVLLMAKAGIVANNGKRMFAGVFVVSNLKIYVLRITKAET